MHPAVHDFLKEYVALCKKHGLAFAVDKKLLAHQVVSIEGDWDFESILEHLPNAAWEDDGCGWWGVKG